MTEAGLAIAPGLPDDLNLSGLEGLFGGLTEAAAPLAELEPALGLDGGLDGEAAPIAGAVTGGDASLPRLDGQLESQLESLFGQAELSELAPKPLADSPEPEPAPLPEALTSLDDLFGGLAASEIQDMFTNEEPVIAAEADDEGEVSGQDAIATPASVASTTDLDSSPAEPPASLAQEAAAIALSQAAPTASPAIVNVANDAANDAANTPASTPARRRPTKAATLISSSPARFNRGRESKVNLRVGLDQVLRLDHLVGELLTNQIQSSDQDDQLRQGVLELLDQLCKHRRTLSDLQTAAQQVGLDEWGRSSPAQDEADALVRPAMTATKRKQGHSSTAPGRGKGQRQSSVVHRAIAIPQLPLSAQFDALEMDRYSDLHIVTQKALNEAVQLEIVIEAVAEQTKQSRQTCDARQRLFRQLRDDLSAVRLKAVGELFDRFPRVLQQLSTTYGKQVELNIIGRHVLVDKVTLDALYDSLLHLVRNAFDHGIGTAAERQAVGKPAQGQIELAAYQQGNRTVIEVRDDGRGVNLERIAEKAIAQGLISATEVESITESQLLEFLFHPGFSTAASVSELSGRGVGLDVVRSQIEALEGNLSIRSELGEGTSFILQFPLSVTITKQLICMAGGTTYAIAADGIEQVLLPRSSQLRSLSDGRTVLTLRQGGEEAIVPVLSLDSLIGNGQGGMGARVQSQGDRPTLPMQPILLVNCSDGLRGIQVEQVMGEQELSIRAMGSAVEPPAYIQGCTVLGDAHLALVIEPSLLLEQFYGPMGDAGTTHSPGFKAQLPQTASASDASDTSLGLASSPASSSMPGSGRANQPQRILIIDDSLTQRRTLERTLNTVGYEVSQAEDGLDAIVRLQQNAEVDLIVCDLEMPRMNGFEFLSQSHSIPGLHGVPIVILTSRSGGKYRQLAQELGAAEFLSKPYTDYELLNTVAQLLKSKVAV
ncbi:MAG: response regulator [Synechococcales cyanobacterium RM1_1_8]|nr:response regulator [Synechococcales cyanobacterium RM1_1_8]